MHSTHAHRVLTHAHSACTHMHTVHSHTYHKVEAYMDTHVYKYKYTSTQCIHTHAHKYKHTLICMHMHTIHSLTCTQVQTHIDRHSQTEGKIRICLEESKIQVNNRGDTWGPSKPLPAMREPPGASSVVKEYFLPSPSCSSDG